uniref:Far-red impaired response-like protein n=1 Tax=Oryza sativa subsp. japonica TaxID=39947 RepID=Q69L82_ORYSJ|nr:far-red impaired response-like protein [Oryza sativa Japonica Group]
MKSYADPVKISIRQNKESGETNKEKLQLGMKFTEPVKVGSMEKKGREAIQERETIRQQSEESKNDAMQIEGSKRNINMAPRRLAYAGSPNIYNLQEGEGSSSKMPHLGCRKIQHVGKNFNSPELSNTIGTIASKVVNYGGQMLYDQFTLLNSDPRQGGQESFTSLLRTPAFDNSMILTTSRFSPELEEQQDMTYEQHISTTHWSYEEFDQIYNSKYIRPFAEADRWDPWAPPVIPNLQPGPATAMAAENRPRRHHSRPPRALSRVGPGAIPLLHLLPRFSPIFGTESSPTSPTMSPTSPAVAASNPPRPATISPPRAYKNGPRAILPLFPNFPEPAALPTALPSLPPRSAAFRRAPAARRRRCSRRRAAPLAPSAPPLFAAHRPPLRFHKTPPKHHIHRAPEPQLPLVTSSRAPPPLPSLPRCATTAIGNAVPRRTPAPTPFPLPAPGTPPPCSPSLSAATAESSRVAPPLRSTPTCAATSSGFVISRAPPALGRVSAMVGCRRNAVPAASRASRRHPFRRQPPPCGRLAVAVLGRLCRARAPAAPPRGRPIGFGPIRAVGSRGPAVDRLGGPGPRWTGALVPLTEV